MNNLMKLNRVNRFLAVLSISLAVTATAFPASLFAASSTAVSAPQATSASSQIPSQITQTRTQAKPAQPQASGTDASEPDAATLNQIRNLIANYHYSGITADKLQQTDLKSMLAALHDPYTVYFSPQGWQQFQDSLENQYSGIGVRMGSDSRGFYADEVFPGSPAEKAGIQEGDYIVKVDGTAAQGLTMQQLVGLVTGPDGSKVDLTVNRSGQTLDIQVTRGNVSIPVATSHWFSDGKVGYISLVDFSSDAGDKTAAAYQALRQDGMKALILDLRDNPGGLLTSAEQIAKLFIPQGTLIHALDHNKVDHPVAFSGGQKANIPVYVLVNENSASASEVLTGALQDYGVAKAVGTKTFGKGSVQTIFQLDNGGYLKLTVDEYRTPKDRKVNGVGLEPDVTVYDPTAQLVTALRLAGEPSIVLDENAHDLTVNGQLFHQRFPTLQKNGEIYAPSRILAAVAGAQITWDKTRHAVVLQQGATKAVYKSDSAGYQLTDNTAFIALNQFSKQFPTLQWQSEGSDLILKSAVRG